MLKWNVNLFIILIAIFWYNWYKLDDDRKHTSIIMICPHDAISVDHRIGDYVERFANDVPKLCHRFRWWPNIQTTLFKCRWRELLMSLLIFIIILFFYWLGYHLIRLYNDDDNITLHHSCHFTRGVFNKHTGRPKGRESYLRILKC